ncbi:MAG TPA: FapA family protein [Rhodocyclaceae bacterium]
MIQEDEKRDAQYRVDVAHDKMAATLTVTPPSGGGAEADAAGIDAALQQAGVIFGIDTEALGRALASPGMAVTVARGEAPKPPVHARLEPLIDVTHTRGPMKDEHGRADFRELGILRAVEPGVPMMRRHPPQDGIPGHTVLGAEIATQRPKDAKFPVRLQGVAVSPDDANLLIAAIAGQPVVHHDGVSVDPVLVMQEVSLSTGNIVFPGTVEVKGDVHGGMKIKAGGDVVIHGTVESAEVEAGGEVQVKGGIIGQHGVSQGRESEKGNSAHIHAQGNVRAHHVDNATIVSGQSVFVDESIVQSDVMAMDEVVVGKQGARKGHVIGGSVRATRSVTAYCLGSPGTNNTRVNVGMNPELVAALDAKKAAVGAKLKEHEDLDKVIKVLEKRPGREEMLAKAKLTFEKTGEELGVLLAEQQALEDQLKLADNAEVVVKAQVHPGTTVTIGRRYTVVSDTQGAGVFRLVTQEVAGREELVVLFTR